MSDANVLREEVVRLGVEATKTREKRPGVRLQWSKEFRQKAVELMSRGVAIKEISEATGIGDTTMDNWRRKARRGAIFSELRLTSSRRFSVEGLTLRTPRGYEVTMTSEHLSKLLRQGVL